MLLMLRACSESVCGEYDRESWVFTLLYSSCSALFMLILALEAVWQIRSTVSMTPLFYTHAGHTLD